MAVRQPAKTKQPVEWRRKRYSAPLSTNEAPIVTLTWAQSCLECGGRAIVPQATKFWATCPSCHGTRGRVHVSQACSMCVNQA